MCQRFVFNTCNQNQGQTIDSYGTELRTKAQSCEYDEQDSLIRDQIVVGTNSTKLQEEMPQDNNLSLQSAISLCKSTRRQMKVLPEKGGALHGNGGIEPVNVIKRDCKRITQKNRYVAPPGETSNCEKCGITHIPKRGPAFNAICHKFKLKGHFSKTMSNILWSCEGSVFF